MHKVCAIYVNAEHILLSQHGKEGCADEFEVEQTKIRRLIMEKYERFAACRNRRQGGKHSGKKGSTRKGGRRPVHCRPPAFCMEAVFLPLLPPHGPFAPACRDFLCLGALRLDLARGPVLLLLLQRGQWRPSGQIRASNHFRAASSSGNMSAGCIRIMPLRCAFRDALFMIWSI